MAVTAPDVAVASFVGAARSFRAATAAAACWSPAQRRQALAEIERVGALMAGARADLIRAEEADRSWVTTGVRSLGDRVGRDTGIGFGAGNALVRQADTWGQVPVLADAAEAGTITTGHVEAVGRATRDASPAVREILTSEAVQRRLVQLAKGMDVPTFSKELARKVATVDPAGPDRVLDKQRRNRSLRLVDTAEGTRITGQVDHQGGRRLRLAIEAASARPAEDDPRTAVQRDADALIDVADAFLSAKDTGSGASVRPHVSLVMSAETLAELRAAQARRAEPAATGGPVAVGEPGNTAEDETGAPGTEAFGIGALGTEARGTGGAGSAFRTGGTGEPGCPVAPSARPLTFPRPVDPVTDEDGVVVPLSEVARILCDCFVTRIAFDQDGEPVDLGRQARLYTGQQRRAVLARDRGCAWQGCTMPARWCEIHHIWWWDRDGGPTDLDNAVALCRFHHQEVHRRDLHLVRHPADPPITIGWVRTGGVDGSPAPGERAPDRRVAGESAGGTRRGETDARESGPGGTDVGELAFGPRPHGRFDPGRPTVRYVIQTRDGTIVAGGGTGARRRTPDDRDPRAGGGTDVLGDADLRGTGPGGGSGIGAVGVAREERGGRDGHHDIPGSVAPGQGELALGA